MPEDDRIELYLGRIIMPRLVKIENAVELLNANIKYFNEQVRCRAEDIEEVNRAVQKHDEIMNGNGKKGLVAAVLSIEEWISKQDRFQWYIMTSTISTIIGVIVTIIYVLLKLK